MKRVISVTWSKNPRTQDYIGVIDLGIGGQGTVKMVVSKKDSVETIFMSTRGYE